MAMTDFSIVVRSLRTRLFSTITTALTVAVAVALMLVLLMMRASAADAFSRQLLPAIAVRRDRLRSEFEAREAAAKRAAR